MLLGIESQCPVVGRATVRGLCCSQEDRDRFRVSCSSLIVHRISPPVASGTVTVHFWPVINAVTQQSIDDLFVVGM